MKRHWLNQYLVILYLALAVDCKSYYTINAPGVIKSNRKYSVLAALHESSEPCTIRISLEGNNFNESRDVVLQSYESKLVDFMPKKLNGMLNLKVEGLKGLQFKNESLIYAETHYGPKVYIQTDKAVYKPQDLVQFRVVILDEHTRPFSLEDPVHVEILDSRYKRVKQLKNITLSKGVYTGKFKLAKYPLLGTWNINVTFEGNYSYYFQSKSITIANYVLPKFSVTLKAPSNIILEDGYLKVVFFGKYVFDKYVSGNATIELSTDYSRRLLQSKQVDIENSGFVDFDLKNDKDLDKYKNLNVLVKLSERYTGTTEIEQQVIHIRNQRYNLEIPEDEIEFENNKPYMLKVYVKHWTGAKVVDRKTPVRMDHGKRIYESFLDVNGAAIFEFEHDPSDNHKFQFKDSKGELPNIFTNSNLMLNNREFYCRLKLVDKNLKLGKPVLIEVSSIVNLPYLMLAVMGHASLIHTEYIKVPPNQKTHIISITPSIEMIPYSFVYIYYIHKGNLRYEEMRLSFPQEFENQISLSAPKQAKPGENVTISINAQTNSYVSLMAVDLGVYLLDKSYDLDRVAILNDLKNEVSFIPLLATVYPGLISGLVTLTNANYPFENDVPYSNLVPYGPISNRYRKKFPETWIFENFAINETTTELTFPLPDTITTWRLTAFTNNDITGFGIVNGPTDITTLQTFFISLNLPYSVKRGEIVSIPITIFNYHTQDLETEVKLYNDDQKFYFMESKLQGVEKSQEEQQNVKLITVKANKAKTVNFIIYPLEVGDIDLKVLASSSLYSDAVLQKLKVEPDGVTKHNNQALYLSIPKGEKISSAFSIKEINESVPDSEYITFSVGGEYLVPTIENFDDLIQIPTGCGEQNMVTFAPSVLILQYLKANNKISKEKGLVENLCTSLEVAYQQQLSFRHDNGGYSVFGMGVDEEPSSWLTAYVVRYFIKASSFIDIDEEIIDSALLYLAQQQKSNGEFPFTGYLLNPNHRNEYGLTAFILMAFLEDQQYASKYKLTIDLGLQFLNSNINNMDDLYVLALMTNALKAAKHQNANMCINQLKALSKEEKGLKCWSANDQNIANDIEITSYAALSLLDTPGDHTSILKWLIQKRNANGGFTSSFDTVVGMEALVKFSEKYRNLQNVNLKISYKAQDQEGNEMLQDTIHVDSKNLLDFQQFELPKNTRQVTFEMEGNGACLVQLNQHYNIDFEDEFRHFKIKTQPLNKNPEELILKICFTYQADSEALNEVTNMIIMEVNLPSGYRSEAEHNKSLRNNKLIQKIESKNLETTIILYLDKLEASTEHCLEIPADKTNEIMLRKPAAIIMYDYYNLTRSNTEFYYL